MLTEQQIFYLKSLLYLRLADNPNMKEAGLLLETIKTLEGMEGKT